MSYTTDTLKEAGTTNPTRAHGYTPGFMNWVVLFIFFSFCFCFVCLRSVSCVQYCKKNSFNCDVQQFHQYQQNLQHPLTEQDKRSRHKTLEIQVRSFLGLTVSLDCLFMIVPSVVSTVYYSQKRYFWNITEAYVVHTWHLDKRSSIYVTFIITFGSDNNFLSLAISS